MRDREAKAGGTRVLAVEIWIVGVVDGRELAEEWRSRSRAQLVSYDE
jgi:hypothetical protein